MTSQRVRFIQESWGLLEWSAGAQIIGIEQLDLFFDQQAVDHVADREEAGRTLSFCGTGFHRQRTFTDLESVHNIQLAICRELSADKKSIVPAHSDELWLIRCHATGFYPNATESIHAAW